MVKQLSAQTNRSLTLQFFFILLCSKYHTNTTTYFFPQFFFSFAAMEGMKSENQNVVSVFFYWLR